jgi:hypothetical protein
MVTKRPKARLFALLLFAIGVLPGIALVGAGAWADIEAMFYGFGKFGNDPVRSLLCPLLITPASGTHITARFRNPSDKPIRQRLRIDVSGLLARKEESRLDLAPHEAKRVAWDVSWNDIDMGFLVLAKVTAYAAYPLPYRESTCGLVAINVPFLTGGWLTALVISLALVCMGAGLRLWWLEIGPLDGRPRQTGQALLFLAAAVVIGLVASLMGLTIVAGLMFLLALLTLAAMLYLLLV